MVNRVLLVEHRQRPDSNAGFTCSTKLWHGGLAVGHDTFLVYSQKRDPMLDHDVVALGNGTFLVCLQERAQRSVTMISLPLVTAQSLCAHNNTGAVLGHGVLAVGHDTELRFPRFWYVMTSFTFPSLPFAVPDVDPVGHCEFLVCSQSDH